MSADRYLGGGDVDGVPRVVVALEQLAAQAWNPRFVAYAALTGAGSPPAARLRDGRPLEFMLWIGQQWRAWAKEAGRPASGSRTEGDHRAFDAWLARRVDESRHLSEVES